MPLSNDKLDRKIENFLTRKFEEHPDLEEPDASLKPTSIYNSPNRF